MLEETGTTAPTSGRVRTQSHTHMHTTERGEREQKEGSLKGALISPVNARVVICELWKYS